ncbi:E3 ubiquitin/ISG15 ligase TRIM25 [Gadus morhua]|uniref:Uncharacterized protein n=1 Tax=Gadus morhua TaxID=8049 RepID=A0A8C5F8J5_GADMO|nr:E3 ubiquitin/ISG15 ligase TRIM25-like [Gadus morhua]XP_030218729.1 E3 ubiquitin/ISG15 ligase TRIM25-like [Gadus morhua]
MPSQDAELMCSVCRDVFTWATPLPCGHTFCPACIREAWGPPSSTPSSSSPPPPGVKGRFSCPQCQEHRAVVPCDCCTPPPPATVVTETAAPTEAVKTCLRCEVSLCARHLRPHLERPAFRHHQLVDPLGGGGGGGGLEGRRCPEHAEPYRYYCSEERAYACGDCLLAGGHAQHRVRPLRQVEEELKVILRTLLLKAEDKLKDGLQVLRDQEHVDRSIAESWQENEEQVERLGVALRAEVEALQGALRTATRRERQRAEGRAAEEGSRVKSGLEQTRSIRHYLAALLAEEDPFLLIWAFQSDDSRLVSDLSGPLLAPDPPTLDRGRLLEELESRYRVFITETLRCLGDLKRELLSSPLTLDTNSAHPLLSVSDDLRSAARVKGRLPCAAHPERFDHWPQVLVAQSVAAGTHYWEVLAEGFWDIGVCYKSIGRKGREGNAFGNNPVSWSLTQQHDRKLAAWHNRRKTRLACQMSGNRVGVALDYDAGTITFCEVCSSGGLAHLYTFSTTFSQPVCLGFGLYKAELNSRVCVLKV